MGAVFVIHLFVFFFCTVHVSCQAIHSSLSQIRFTTGDKAGGGTITITVHWNGKEFSCSKNPSSKNSNYQCNSPSQSSRTADPSIPYHIYVEWPRTNAALQIKEFRLTDGEGTRYTIQKFCHPYTMQCTLDPAVGSKPSCSQWGSKDSYDYIELGSNSKFSALYVDIPIFGSRFANSIVEGGVRPPNLVTIALTTADASLASGVVAVLSAQWDTGLYQCDIQPDAQYTQFSCNVDALHCPAMTNFWMSAYSNQNGAEFLIVKAIMFEDETGTQYTFADNFCRDPGSPQTGGNNCPGHSYDFYTTIYIGGVFMTTTFTKLVPFFVPDCVFDYPNNPSNGVEVDVGAGSVTATTPKDSEFAWDETRYGGPIDRVCPETPDPTTDPTRKPTTDPTDSPTREPTRHPTKKPTRNPTRKPTRAPTTPPTTAPTDAPTHSPTPAPTIDPTRAPTNAPTTPPTNAPSGAPSSAPSDAPSSAPTTPPSRSPSVAPSNAPSGSPTTPPSSAPTSPPTLTPTNYPTLEPTTAEPTTDPTAIALTLVIPTVKETKAPDPTMQPTEAQPIANAPVSEDWITRNWIFFPAIIGGICFLLCIAVFFVMQKKKKKKPVVRVEIDAQSPRSAMEPPPKKAQPKKAKPKKANKRIKKKISKVGAGLAPGAEPRMQQRIMNEFAELVAAKQTNKPKVELVYGVSEGRVKGIPRNNPGNTHGEGQNSFINHGNNALLNVVEAENDEVIYGSELGSELGGTRANPFTVHYKKKKKQKKNVLYNMNGDNDEEVSGSESGDLYTTGVRKKKKGVFRTKGGDEDDDILYEVNRTAKGSVVVQNNPLNPYTSHDKKDGFNTKGGDEEDDDDVLFEVNRTAMGSVVVQSNPLFPSHDKEDEDIIDEVNQTAIGSVAVAQNNPLFLNMNPADDNEVFGSEMGKTTDGQTVTVTPQYNVYIDEENAYDDDAVIGGMAHVTLGDIVVDEEPQAVAQPPMVTGSMIERMIEYNGCL